MDLFRDRDKHSGIWLPNKVTRFPFPLECVSGITVKRGKVSQKRTKALKWSAH